MGLKHQPYDHWTSTLKPLPHQSKLYLQYQTSDMRCFSMNLDRHFPELQATKSKRAQKEQKTPKNPNVIKGNVSLSDCQLPLSFLHSKTE